MSEEREVKPIHEHSVRIDLQYQCEKVIKNDARCNDIKYSLLLCYLFPTLNFTLIFVTSDNVFVNFSDFQDTVC